MSLGTSLEMGRLPFEFKVSTVGLSFTKIKGRILVRLGRVVFGTGLAKRRAVRAYEQTLRRQGLPEPIIASLVADYDLSLVRLLKDNVLGRE